VTADEPLGARSTLPASSTHLPGASSETLTAEGAMAGSHGALLGHLFGNDDQWQSPVHGEAQAQPEPLPT
jgi:hypothetical protein